MTEKEFWSGTNLGWPKKPPLKASDNMGPGDDPLTVFEGTNLDLFEDLLYKEPGSAKSLNDATSSLFNFPPASLGYIFGGDKQKEFHEGTPESEATKYILNPTYSKSVPGFKDYVDEKAAAPKGETHREPGQDKDGRINGRFL
jgi:hypothetical protein